MGWVTRLRVAVVSRLLHLNEALVFYPRLRRFYRSLGSIDTVLDVGANRGQSIRFFRALNPQARVWAFEASPITFARLAPSAAPGVRLFNVGVSAVPGTMTFHHCVLEETSSFSLPDFESEHFKRKARILGVAPEAMFTAVDVPVTTVDAVVAENALTSVSVLKVDVEGHELEVLQGAATTLANRLVATVQLEEHSGDMRSSNATAIDALLAGHGYRRVAEIKHGFGSFAEVLYRR